MGHKGAKNVRAHTDLVRAQNIHPNSHVAWNSPGLIRELAAMVLPAQPSTLLTSPETPSDNPGTDTGSIIHSFS